jgi:di/tricarboxylate transporter
MKDAASAFTLQAGGASASRLLQHHLCSEDHVHVHDHDHDTRLLQTTDAPVWQTVVVGITIVIMLAVIVSDRIGPDWVMVTALMVFMVTEIITVSEGLAGFSNSGVLTVMALFVVAEGVSRTGALDYYMGKILGKPKTIAGAQIRLMIPIGAASAFLNNTPIVAVMIPLVLRWAKVTGIPRQQLLIPLSYATILGGTCTLVGTSTNLVVSGYLQKDYPGTPAGDIGLFDVGVYGVPNMFIGMVYMLIFSPLLLPYGKINLNTESDAILLGARVTPWSPAAGRTVRRSGLGNSGGIYLVNVRRFATGNMQYAVSKDFVVSVGDELYFTGSVGEFSDFCEKHGLEIITTEDLGVSPETPDDIGTTIESISNADESALLQLVNHISDQIDGREPVDSGSRPTRVIVTSDVSHSKGVLVVGVDCLDRPGLLMDISKALFQLNLMNRHSEAEVFGDRSLSIWRCEAIGSSSVDHAEVWTALSDLLHESDQAAGRKKSGTRVVRAVVTKASNLIGKKPTNVKFRDTYRAAIIAYQKNGKNVSMNSEFEEGDLLVLQVLEGSPLLTKPPTDFYKNFNRSGRSSLFGSTPSTTQLINNKDADLEEDHGIKLIWKNLKVEFEDDGDASNGDAATKGEFLTAFVVPPHSPLENKSLNQLGYSSLPGVVLVSIERRQDNPDSKTTASAEALSPDEPLQVGDVFWMSGSGEAIGDLQKVHGLVFFEKEEIKKVANSLQDRRLVQAVVARGSPLVGQTVAEARFRSEYGGAIIAIQRGSERVHEHPGKVKLQTGDALLIQAGPSFLKQNHSNYKTFALVSEVENSSPPRPRLFLLCVLMIIASLVVAGLEIRSLLVTASIVGIVMVSVGVVTQQEARDCLQWDLYVVVACAFGIGTAMENSGVATGLATFLVSVGTSIGLGGEYSCLPTFDCYVVDLVF